MAEQEKFTRHKEVHWSKHEHVKKSFITGFHYEARDAYPKRKGKCFKNCFVGSQMGSALLSRCYHATTGNSRSFPHVLEMYMSKTFLPNSTAKASAVAYIDLINLHRVGYEESIFLPTRPNLNNPNLPLLQLLSFEFNHFCNQNTSEQSKVHELMKNICENQIEMILTYAKEMDIQQILVFFN